MTLSLFEHFTCVTPIEVTMSAIADIIRGDRRLAETTALYRRTRDKNIKRRSPLFAVACRLLNGRRRTDVVGLTGLSLVDLDHITEASPDVSIDDVREKICRDPHTLLCYTTISGDGLRIIFRYDVPPDILSAAGQSSPRDRDIGRMEQTARAAFVCGNTYYERLTTLKGDEQCKNITRLSGLAHDPHVFYNADAVAFTADDVGQCMKAKDTEAKTDRNVRRVEAYYQSTIRPALEKENIRYAPGSHNRYVMRAGYMFAKRRYPRDTVIEWARTAFADYADTVQVISSCYNSVATEREERGRKAFASVEDILSFLTRNIRLRHNVITGRVEYLMTADGTDAEAENVVWQCVNDRVVNSLWRRMSETMRVNIADIYRVIESDHVPLHNPFVDYLDSLPPSDGGTSHISQLAATIRIRGDDRKQRLWETYLTKWLVAMVAAWIDDSVVNNVILVLIGEQGVYKTTWFNYLLPPLLRKYFYTKTNASRMGRDDLLVLAQYALVCCEEIDSMKPSEVNQLKAAVTMSSIDERAAYAHYHEHRPHIASFCATGNNVQFLSDTSGNRRWLPFEVESIVSPRMVPFDYDGIFSEVLQLYRSGFRYWFDKEEIAELNRHNRHFETPRLEVEQLMLYFRKPGECEAGVFMTTARIMQVVSDGVAVRLSAVNVGRAMVELGFKSLRFNGVRGFLVVQRSAEEIRSIQSLMAAEAVEEDLTDDRC